MSVISDAAVSRGDLSKRLDALEAEVKALKTARRAEATAVGRNGVRVHSGGSVRLEGGGSLLVEDGGDVRVTGGQIVIQDPSGAETFLAGTDGLSLTGLLEVLGGGDISVTDGRLVAADEDGEVFAVDPTVPRIFMRKALISDLSAQIFAERVHQAFTVDPVFRDDTGGNFISLSGGPSISNINVSTGVMLIWIDASIRTAIGPSATGEAIGECSPHITGATTKPANTLSFKEFGQTRGSADFQHNINDRSSTLFIAPDLNPGAHTVEVRYRVWRSGGGQDVEFRNRGMAVIAL